MLRILSAVAPRVVPVVVIESEGEFADVARGIGCEVMVRPMGVLRRNRMQPVRAAGCMFEAARAAIWLAKYVRENQIHLVFTSTVSVLAGAMAARLAGCRHIWFVQEILGGRSRHLAPLVARLSSRIVTVSQASAQSVHRGKRNVVGLTRVVYPGVNPAAFDGADGAFIRRKYCKFGGEVLIGLVGRIHYWKGQDYFLDALAQLKMRGVDGFHALIVGEVYAGYEPLKEDLRAKVRKLGLEDRVTFTGHVDQVENVFDALDIVVAPSTLPDPFCLVVAEGMAARRPVISTAWGGPAEIIEDGVSGFLIPPNEAHVFADRLELLVRNADRRRVMGEAARRRVENRFEARAFDEEMTALIEEFASPGRLAQTV